MFLPFYFIKKKKQKIINTQKKSVHNIDGVILEISQLPPPTSSQITLLNPSKIQQCLKTFANSWWVT